MLGARSGFRCHQARFLRARSAGVLASARARCGAGACFAVGGRFAARQGLGKAGDHRLARRLRQAPLAGHVGAARALHLLRPIRVGTLGTAGPEKAAARARRAPIAAQGRPPDMMRLPHDAGRPPRGAHAVRAAWLSLAHLIQECAPRGRELLSPRGPRGSAGWTPPGNVKPSSQIGGH